MLKEDNSGFIKFPIGEHFSKLDTGKTFIYLLAFDIKDINGDRYILSNLNINLPGTFVGDDITQRDDFKLDNISIDDLIKDQIKNDEFDKVYFPNLTSKSTNKVKSIPITSSICIGWNDYTYEMRNSIGFWKATFNDLTNEGKRLYYSIKKLHNNKEVRILTFNNI